MQNVSRGQYLSNHRIQGPLPGAGGRWVCALARQPWRGQLLTVPWRESEAAGEAGRRPPHLELGGAALTAHGVAAGAEGRVDLLLAAQHAQHGLLQLAQLLLQHPGLLAAEALAAAAVHAAVRGLQRGARGAVLAPRDQVHHAGVVQSPPGMVVHLLRRSFNIEDVLLAEVNVLVQKQRCQMALQVSTVLHHDGTGHRVTPTRGD